MEDYERLEHRLADWVGCEPRQVVACASGTAALHLALEALSLPAVGGQVLVPNYTMVACARAVTLADLEPVFVDCTDDMTIDPSLLTMPPPGDDDLFRVRAVMPVHVYGRRCAMEKIVRIAARNRWMVVEDMAEAHGVQPHSRTDAACWSFYRNKIVAGEEGGAVMFKSREAAHLARQLRCLGFTERHDYRHVRRGHNYRMSNVHARLILDSLKDVSANLMRRRQVEAALSAAVPAFCQQAGFRDAPWVFDVRVPGMPQDVQYEVVRLLQEDGIPARHGFCPMTFQEEYYEARYLRRDVLNDRSDRLRTEVFYVPLPVYADDDERPDRIREYVGKVREVFDRIVG